MRGINEWVVGIVAFILIATLISHLIGNLKFFKYIKFFMGIVLILVVIKPVGSLLKLDSVYDNILNICKGEFEISELKTQLDTGLGEYSDNILKSYKEGIAETISSIVKEDGYEVDRVETEIYDDRDSEEYGLIKSIKVYISEASKYAGIKIDKISIGKEAVDVVSQTGSFIYGELKEHIADKFNIMSDDVDIVVTGG